MQTLWLRCTNAVRVNALPWHIGFGLTLFLYIAYRAYALSITHDEAGTTDLLALTYQDIIGSPRAFTSANNHILNSWLMKFFVSLFGDAEWVLRLPNVLAFPVYFWGCRKLSTCFSADAVIQSLILLIFCAHPYVIDFFSLCRGYGLALAFQSLAFVHSYQFLQHNKFKSISLAALMLAGSVFANLTWLNLLMAWWMALGLYFFFKEGIQGIFSRSLYFVVAAVMHALLAVVLWNPLQWIRAAGELRWGSNGWFDAQHSFSKDYLYTDNPWLAMFLQGVMFLVFVWMLRYSFRHRKELKINHHLGFPIFLFLILVCCIAWSVGLRNFTDTFYPNGRKALMYFMLWDSMWISLILFLPNEKHHLKRIAASALVLMLSGMVLLQTNRVREWGYDNQTKFVFQWLSSYDTSQTTLLDVHWKFKQAMDYYLRHSGIQHWSIRRTDQADTSRKPDFVYTILEKDQHRLPYPVVLSLDENRVLYKTQLNHP